METPLQHYKQQTYDHEIENEYEWILWCLLTVKLGRGYAVGTPPF